MIVGYANEFSVLRSALDPERLSNDHSQAPRRKLWTLRRRNRDPCDPTLATAAMVRKW